MQQKSWFFFVRLVYKFHFRLHRIRMIEPNSPHWPHVKCFSIARWLIARCRSRRWANKRHPHTHTHTHPHRERTSGAAAARHLPVNQSFLFTTVQTWLYGKSALVKQKLGNAKCRRTVFNERAAQSHPFQSDLISNSLLCVCVCVRRLLLRARRKVHTPVLLVVRGGVRLLSAPPRPFMCEWVAGARACEAVFLRCCLASSTHGNSMRGDNGRAEWREGGTESAA